MHIIYIYNSMYMILYVIKYYRINGNGRPKQIINKEKDN